MALAFFWIVWTIATAAGLLAVLVGWGLVYVMRQRVRTPRISATARQEFPSHDENAVRLVAAALEQWGFEAVGAMKRTAFVEGQPAVFDAVFFHAKTQCFALASRSEMPQDNAPYSVTFANLRADGKGIFTVNRLLHAALGTLAELHVEDAQCDNLEAHWQRHQRRLADAQPKPWITEVSALVEMLQSVSGRLMERLQKFGKIRASGEVFSVRPVAAFWVLIGAWFKPKHMRKPYRLLPMQSDALEHALDSLQGDGAQGWQHFQLALEAAPKKRNPWHSTLWFVLLAVLAGVSFGLISSWSVAPALLLIIGVHEFGHYLAMRAFGYRNVDVFFIPFFGGVTTGSKDDATPLQQLVVYLAGPVPGLIAGLAYMLFVPANDAAVFVWLREAAWLSVIVNALNLLPLVPLDGGRIVELFVFARRWLAAAMAFGGACQAPTKSTPTPACGRRCRARGLRGVERLGTPKAIATN
jgi:hypothetical protein